MRFFRLAFALATTLAAGCSSPLPSPAVVVATDRKPPLRIVSLDYCADQFVLKLAPRRSIVALSPDATRAFSYMRKEAVGIATVRPDAEAVLALNPDLIVRSYGGGPNAVAFFERADIKVHQISWGEGFDAVRNNVRDAARAMGQSTNGDAVVAEFDARLAGLVPASGVSTLYMTAGGVTTGPGSMVDLMITTAGLTNFQIQDGWNQLPLERLVTQRPDMAATAFFGETSRHQDYWSVARHPIAQALLKDLPVAQLDSATTTCGGWFIMDAIELLAQKGRAVQTSKATKS